MCWAFSLKTKQQLQPKTTLWEWWDNNSTAYSKVMCRETKTMSWKLLWSSKELLLIKKITIIATSKIHVVSTGYDNSIISAYCTNDCLLSLVCAQDYFSGRWSVTNVPPINTQMDSHYFKMCMIIDWFNLTWTKAHIVFKILSFQLQLCSILLLSYSCVLALLQVTVAHHSRLHNICLKVRGLSSGTGLPSAGDYWKCSYIFCSVVFPNILFLWKLKTLQRNI